MAKQKKKALEEMLQPVQQLHKNTVASLVAIAVVNAELEEKEREQLEEIDTGFAVIVSNLAKEKDKIITEVKSLYKAKCAKISSNEELQAEEAILSKAIESVKDITAANSTVETFSKMSEQQET